MKVNLLLLFSVMLFILVGCTNETDLLNESSSVTVTNTIFLELNETEEADIFTRTVAYSMKEPGIVNMANPQYQFSIGEESYFLWITEDSGTIMNTKDTHTIYSLTNSSVEEIYEFVSNKK